jgi:folate-dependent phosphoribosylglycinamide formyltransferase PurN
MSHDEIMDWLRKSYPDDVIRSKVIVTLHGYMRIVAPDVCVRYRMYNGHPGAIDLYPDLKGKDPQVRAWENKGSYKFLGSVVHEVVPEVDAGKIIKSVHLTNTAQSCDDAFNMLKLTSLTAWNFAFKEIMK